jgi:hypothetical protein
VWRACERFGIRPPGLKAEWDEIHPWHQAQALAFDQIRSVEEAQLAMAGAMKGF